MAEIIIGEVPGLTEGMIFETRIALTKAGGHRVTQQGIDGNKKDGAASIVLSGGYPDDLDSGDYLVYTGQGGQLNQKQVKDQSFETPGNKALLTSQLHGNPVRVFRGIRKESDKNRIVYQYGGLYSVTGSSHETGIEGFEMCRFILEKVKPLEAIALIPSISLSAGNEETRRANTTTLRIVRDTKLSKQIKTLYNYTCQVCGIRISENTVGYAEAAHIRPLGSYHKGFDVPSNIICLCPNHHVMFDLGIFSINSDLTLKGISGSLNQHSKHILSTESLAYHLKHIYKPK